MSDRKRIVVIALIVLLVIAAILGWSIWRKSQSARPSSTPTQTVQTTKKPTGSPTKSTQATATATPEQVRAKAVEIGKKMSDTAGMTVPGDQKTTYGIIMSSGQKDADRLNTLDENLSDRIKADSQFGDEHSAKDSADELQALESDYTAWETELWSVLNGYANQDADQRENSVSIMKSKSANLCQDVQNLMPSRPKAGAGQKSYEELRSWLNKVDDTWIACEARRGGVA